MTRSTSPSSGGPSLAVIDTPATPPGWEDARAELIRIVDPLGKGVAWLAPGSGGRCVGYAVRPSGEKGTPWTHLFQPAIPGDRSVGCGPRCILIDPDGQQLELSEVWRFVQRDPTAAWLGNRAKQVNFVFSATLDRGLLEMELFASNAGGNALWLRCELDVVPGLAQTPVTFRADAGITEIRNEDDSNVASGRKESLLGPGASFVMRAEVSNVVQPVGDSMKNPPDLER